MHKEITIANLDNEANVFETSTDKECSCMTKISIQATSIIVTTTKFLRHKRAHRHGCVPVAGPDLKQ